MARKKVVKERTVTPLALPTTLSYNYEATTGSAPASGYVYQSTDDTQLVFNVHDQVPNDNTAFFGTLNNNDTITANGLTWTITHVGAVSGGTVTITINPPEQALPFGVTGFTFNVEATGELPTFPAFTPIIPTSPFPPGGGVGSIGDPVGYPTFPPPTPPPIGQVPTGPLVGPAVAAAPVPPSLAGIVQPVFRTGSATSPPANGYFPQFTTAPYTGFPNQPPNGVPLVFLNTFNQPSFSGGVWTYPAIPSTPTTGVIILDGWGLPGPSGSGPGPPSSPNPPGAGLPHVSSVRDGYAEPAERSGGSVFSDPDTAHLHQQIAAQDSRRKRLSARHPSRRADAA